MNCLYHELPSSLLDDFLKNVESEEKLRVDLFDGFGEYDKNDYKLAVASCFVSLMLKSIRQSAKDAMSPPTMVKVEEEETTSSTTVATLGQLVKIDDLLERFKGYSKSLDPNERLIENVGFISPEKYTRAIDYLEYEHVPAFCASLFLKYCRLMNYYKELRRHRKE